MNIIEPKLDLVDRVIKMAELAIQGKDVNGLSDELVYGIRCIQHPPIVVNPLKE